MTWDERKPLLVALLLARKARLEGTRDTEVDAAIASLVNNDDGRLASTELELEYDQTWLLGVEYGNQLREYVHFLNSQRALGLELPKLY